MFASKKILGLIAALTVGALALFGSSAAQSATPSDLPPGADPAHHSTDVNDPDPAHHRPYYVCSASTNTCVLTPVTGFDLNGQRVTGTTTTTTTVPGQKPVVPSQFANYNPDPAHHSTDLNDPDPAHHQPTLEYNESTGNWELVAIPGFDLQGYRLSEGTVSPAFFK